MQRIFVHREVFDRFVDRLLAETAAQKVGDPMDPDTDVGPLITEADAQRVEAWVREAVEGGARVLAGGRREGSVVEPTVGQRYVPSVDVMFESASEVFGSKLLGVVLTGMGNDGARGTAVVHNGGGQVIAEAEETSVVFGMPKEAIATGKVDKVVPLSKVCGEILRRCGF